MLKFLTAELSLRADEFMPVARTAVVADPAPAKWPGAWGRDGARAPGPCCPLPTTVGPSETAPARSTRTRYPYAAPHAVRDQPCAAGCAPYGPLEVAS